MLRGSFLREVRQARIGLFFLLCLTAAAGFAQSQTVDLATTPSAPTTQDSLRFRISGVWNSSCVPEFDRGSVVGSRIEIRLVTPNSFCSFAQTPYIVDVNSNPLGAGTYEVFVLIDGIQWLTDFVTVSSAGSGGPTITVEPAFPTTEDIVSITIEGTSSDGCTPRFAGGNVQGFDITIDLTESTGPCTQVVTPYSVGPVTAGPLAAGTYTVRLTNNGQPFGGTETFTVTEPAASGCSDLDNGVVCLQDDRFELTMTWELGGVTRPVVFESDGKATALGFFQPAPRDNVVTAKVTNGCSQNGFYWVWLGTFTRAAQLELTVVDRQNGRSRTYRNSAGNLMTTIKDDTFFQCSP